MKITRFRRDGGISLGAVFGDEVADLTTSGHVVGADLVSILETGKDLSALAEAAGRISSAHRLPIAGMSFELPIAWPRRIFCLGLNYSAHVEESGFKRQTVPAVFVRTPTSLVAHGEALELPKVSEKFDYEAELAVVVGRRLRSATEDEALQAVAAYSCFNDGSIRDFQHATVQWTMGKNFDRSGSMGPWLVTPDELPTGADGLAIQCRLNSEILQSANTREMIFKVGETLAFISQALTLLPGDVIAMGTPQGVGHARNPPIWMKAGDRVEVEIEGIGVLSNPVVAVE